MHFPDYAISKFMDLEHEEQAVSASLLCLKECICVDIHSPEAWTRAEQEYKHQHQNEADVDSKNRQQPLVENGEEPGLVNGRWVGDKAAM